MMSASKGNDSSASTLSGTIRRQLSTQANRYLLTRLPAFSPQQEPLPEKLSLLLAELDQRGDKATATAPESPATD